MQQRTGTSQLFSEEPGATGRAAILFAAACVDGAVQVLGEEIQRNDSNPKPWHMLLDAHRISGDRVGFERVAARYRQAFHCDAPSWLRATMVEPAPGMERLAGVIDAMADLAPLIGQARHRRMVGVDMSAVERIGFAFAGEMCALLRGYGLQGKRIILGNVSDLHAELLEAVGGIGKIVLLRSRAVMQERLMPLQAA